ncbi:BapA/Bap/LapF family prefix-like domain-containing protein, partial [Acinetobacter soli]|uniref:BapA/Bap/LapF family prefix-like domain-containing protein n=1 Tax=Acinetobacter soli TaxID=487316 RepID=UPI0032B4B208
MSYIKIISKESHNVLSEVDANKIALTEASVVLVKVSIKDVEEVLRDGTNAIIKLKNGEVIVIENFFSNQAPTDNSLVFQDDSNKLIWVQFTDAQGSLLEAVVYQPLDSIEPLLYTTNDTSPWAWAAIPVATGGILWWAHQHDSKNIQSTEKPLTPTSEPKAFDDVGIIQGQIKAGSATDDNQPTFKGIGTSGQIITIYDGNVVIGTTIVSSDGTWTFTPTTPLADGDHIISYTIKDHPDSVESGKSPVLDFILDTTAPAQPSAPTGYVDNVGDNQGTFAGGTA